MGGGGKVEVVGAGAMRNLGGEGMAGEPVVESWRQPAIKDWRVIDSTLREGEQFVNAFFTLEQKIAIAKQLSEFGVEYIELTNPAASPMSRRDCEKIAALDLKCKTLVHTRCNVEDAMMAVKTGVHGVNLLFGTSNYLRQYSHGRSIEYIIEKATEVVTMVKSAGCEARFSCEDSFRSSRTDLNVVYKAMDRIGVDRVGVADTVGIAHPRQVFEFISDMRSTIGCDIEVHFHNDTGCAIANSYSALEAGATHVDTSILGIGERNGITPLGGFMSRMYANDQDDVRKRYNLPMLQTMENYVAETVDVQVPFNNCITGYSAFAHKAGIHLKAMMKNTSAYEILEPSDFGMDRKVAVAHRLTGWNVIKHRANQIGLNLTDHTVKEATEKIKVLADVQRISIDDVDTILREYDSFDVKEVIVEAGTERSAMAEG